ncbi:MAG: formylglycine-generating enzyme family protein, partial [Planctomycetota bacterium]
MSDAFTNTIGMTFVRIPARSFLMGDDDGDFDEKPAHPVTISNAFEMAVTPVTNAQYEQFDPRHRALRGRRGFSNGDDEAVVFVNWHEAVAFCEWLSTKEGRRCHLPTEAEWEYACRAGTTTPYHTGEDLPAECRRHQQADWDPTPVDLTVGRSAPNAFGLHDMHGPVEQWCSDWYGPYEPGEQVDPVGRATGEMKVTRGGSHNADVEFLRSANRLGTLPADKHWLIGLRVVCGEPRSTAPLPPPEPPLWARDVSQRPHDWPVGPDPAAPYFAYPRVFVRIPDGANGPLYSRHNHCPSVAWCANGDLLAAWFSTNTEKGREMAIAAARLRRGATEWDDADVFFKAPDRNMTGTALF